MQPRLVFRGEHKFVFIVIASAQNFHFGKLATASLINQNSLKFFFSGHFNHLISISMMSVTHSGV
jgi:hypothetical protein